MKKVSALILAFTLVLALAACGGEGSGGGTVSNLTDDELVEKLGDILDGKTGEMMTDTYALSAMDDPAAVFGGWFGGYALPDGAKVAVNQPMMGSIAHVVLLIQPPEGTDAATLAGDLEKNADPRWNICVEADTVKHAEKDGLILFIMTNSEVVNADDVIAAFNG